MIIETSRVKLDGHRLHRLTLTPPSGIRGGLIFFHGQGDFIDRYPPVLEPFVRAGYQCLLTDLPGHGRSPGKRGHVPGLPLIESLLADSLSQLKGPVIIAGHSMGGLLALHLLLEQPDRFAAAWISSPLLRVIERASPGLRLILPVLAKLTPRLTVDTGVRRDQCEAPTDEAAHPENENDVLYHSRISLAWGVRLCEVSEAVWNKAAQLGSIKRPLLITQGEEDEICPPDTLTAFLAKSEVDRGKLHLIAGARHEPFRAPTREMLLAILQRWIEEEITGKTPPPKNPREA
jgi:alpha-beta hydrolase superfamily lysophospholipase